MRVKEVTEDGVKYIIVSVPTGLFTAFISKSGKSLVWRVCGSYITRDGYVKGGEGQYSPYLHALLNMTVKPVKNRSYGPAQVFTYAFDKHIGIPAIKIAIQ